MHVGRHGVELVMDALLEKLRSKLLFDGHADQFFEHHGSLIKLDQSRFAYLTNEQGAATTVFVDGGSAELFSAADFSLYFFRIASVQYQGKKQVRHGVRELYAFIDVDDEKSLRIQLFGVDEQFSRELHQRAAQFFTRHPIEHDLSAVGSALLQLGEYIEIARLARELKPKDLIVRDGSLDVFFEVFSDTVEFLTKRQIFLCGLAKTNTLRTTSGRSVSFVLEKKSNIGSWYYPITKHLFFTKLHPKAKHVFRCDVALPHYSIFSALSAHAADPTFLGYPYGLIEADRMARVSMDESSCMRKTMKMKLGKDAANLDVLLGTSAAHGILDKMRF